MAITAVAARAPAAESTAPTPGAAVAVRAHAMAGARGDYPTTRDASGTAWQPDASPHSGLHVMGENWMLMGHARLNGVYDRQSGPRGGQRSFVSGMVMGVATRRSAGGRTWQLRAMLSPDPLMGRSGYPLLLASGETADGRSPLIDRQHPHDLFMELSVSYAVPLGVGQSAFVYAGLPGEPAFGPPAFMHRLSIGDSTAAPITHHWLDSTHIAFGVVTAGYVHGRWKLEASRFRGREPDQHRYDIERGALDSTAARLSWNPAAEFSLQASWARVAGAEQLKPTERQRKYSASVIYTRTLGDRLAWSGTLAFGRRDSGAGPLDAWALESALHRDDGWALFGRAERVRNDELGTGGETAGPVPTVGKLEFGLVRELRVAAHLRLGLGGLYGVNFVPSPLRAAYGGDPHGAMLFLRLSLE